MPKKPHRNQALIHHTTLRGIGDGVDPRLCKYGEVEPSRPRTTRHAGQLCRQVSEAIHLALCDTDDDVLRDLLVVDVSPAPHEGRLLVTLTPGPASAKLPIAIYHEKLLHQSNRLRHIVAEEIHRRKVPELVYHVVTRV